MASVRQLGPAPLYQGEHEAIAYSFSTLPWGVATPEEVSVTVYAGDGARWEEEVTATVMPSGTPSVAGAVITLPLLRALTPGRRYRVQVQFTGSGNRFETWAEVIGER